MQNKTTNERYVAVSSTVLHALATNSQLTRPGLMIEPAQFLIPVRIFEADTAEQFKREGQSQKEIAKMQTILDHPFRFVVKEAAALENGMKVDYRFWLYDVLEHFYLEFGYVQATGELLVVDSYYRHNDFMTKEQQVELEVRLVRMLFNVAVVSSYALESEASVMVPVQIKALKTAFLTQRQRQLKSVYKNKKLTISQWATVDVTKLNSPLKEAFELELKTEMIDAVLPVEVSSESLPQAELAGVTKVETKKAPSKKKTSTAKKAVREEVVLEVLEDGTKIVQYERAGYWRTQKNKTTGEEKKIWIEPKLMTRKVAAK